MVLVLPCHIVDPGPAPSHGDLVGLAVQLCASEQRPGAQWVVIDVIFGHIGNEA